MADSHAGESKILATYRARTRRAAELHRKARDVLPGGIVHDSRRMSPYGIYGLARSGARKWTRRQRLRRYYRGHGSLLLGASDPKVLEAIRRARKGSIRRGPPS